MDRDAHPRGPELHLRTSFEKDWIETRILVDQDFTCVRIVRVGHPWLEGLDRDAHRVGVGHPWSEGLDRDAHSRGPGLHLRGHAPEIACEGLDCVGQPWREGLDRNAHPDGVGHPLIERGIFEGRDLYLRDLRHLHPRELHHDGPDGGAHPRGLGLPLRQDLFETHIRMELDILGADECWPCPARGRWPRRSARERTGLDVCFAHLVESCREKGWIVTYVVCELVIL